jgi:hypothetical protein
MTKGAKHKSTKYLQYYGREYKPKMEGKKKP